MKNTVRIVSTKKLLPNQRQYLLNAGLAVIDADFIAIEYVHFVLAGVKENLIFTSANAFKSFLKNPDSDALRHQAVFCVGQKTRQAIEEKGFRVKVAADNADALAQTIVKEYAGETFTFFSGSMRRDELTETLEKSGVIFNEIEVYTTGLHLTG